jgi:hypothetical protein
MQGQSRIRINISRWFKLKFEIAVGYELNAYQTVVWLLAEKTVFFRQFPFKETVHKL